MIKKLSIIIFFIVFASRPANAQLKDTIIYSIQQKPKYFATLASFNTFIDHNYANIFRIKTGLSYNQRIRFGIGYSNLANNAVTTDSIHLVGDNYNYYTKGILNFSFVSISAEYFFYNNYPWQFTITPFQIGYGGANYEYYNYNRQLSYTATEKILLYQPEISAQYSIFPWFGVGLTMGYRMTLVKSRKIVERLDAPTYAIDLRLFLDEVYKILFKKDEKSE